MLMAKVNIMYRINNDSKALKGILNDEIISFIDEDFKFNFDLNSLVLKRSSSEYNTLLDFSNLLFSYSSFGMSFDIPIKIEKIDKKTNSFDVSYRLEDEVINFYIEFEVI